MTDIQELTNEQQLIVKLRNRDKAIELLSQEILSLRLRVRDDYSEKDLLASLAECRQKSSTIHEIYDKFIKLTKSEKKEFQRDELIQRLNKQLKGLEDKNKKLTIDNNSLINKLHTSVFIQPSLT